MGPNKKKTLKASGKKGGYFDYSLLFIIIFLLCFGLVMLYSTSSYNAQIKFGSSTWYLFKQIQATVLGLIGMFIVTRIDYHFWKRFTVLLYFASIVCILMVLSPLGMEVNGARRWLDLKIVSFQPAEFAKLALILFMALFINKNAKMLRSFSGVLKTMMFCLPPVVLIAAITKNLSSAIILIGIAFIMVFVASPKYSHFVVMAGLVIAFGGAFIALESFRMTRLKVWLHPESYSQEGGFQVLQALYAIGSGGLFGKGLGQSIQKLGFVPEAQNDMIFTIICEELGLFGGICVLMMFLFMIWRFMVIANNAPDLFGSLLVVGIMAHIAIQVLLNVLVVTNTIPNTGITLPFISYGGTSILFLMAEMGLALSVSRSIKSE